MLGNDLSLVDEIQRRHAQVAGTAKGSFLWQANRGTIFGWLCLMPYVLKQLQKMLNAIRFEAATEDAGSSCSSCCKQSRHSAVLCGAAQVPHGQIHPVPSGAEGTGDGAEVEFDIDNKRFELKQKDKHSLRMDRERAELKDHSAKRCRFSSGTDDTVLPTEACCKGCRRGR